MSAGKEKKVIRTGSLWGKYFGSGAYSEKYPGKLLPRNAWAITDAAKDAIRDQNLPSTTLTDASAEKAIPKKTLRILDYGCGDGRAFDFIRSLAEKLNVNIELIAYDPSKEGLEVFRKKLLNTDNDFEDVTRGTGRKEFEDIEPNQHEDGKPGYEAMTLKKGSISVRFIHGNVEDPIEHIQDLLGAEPFDLSLAMFGIFSYIPGRELRQKTIKMINDVTSETGRVIASVPGKKRFPEEQSNCKKLRAERATLDVKDLKRATEIDEELGLAQEDGDVSYTRKIDGEDVKYYYHIYSAGEFEEDLKVAGLKTKGAEIDYMSSKMDGLLKGPKWASADGWGSWALSKAPSFVYKHVVDKLATDILAVSTPTRQTSTL